MTTVPWGATIENWSTGIRPLRQAVRYAYAATRATYPHPFHWAAFSLFGNRRLLFESRPSDRVGA
jgi:hypothetical protein